MSPVVSVRRTLALAAVASCAILVGCAEPAAPPAPPPPPPVPAVSLSSKLIDQASAYRAYVDSATQISPDFTDGASVAASLRKGESYEPGQLLRGAIAYGAVVALQDPAFRAAVRIYAVDPDQRRTVAYDIMKDPAYVLGMKDVSGAAGLVMSALGEDGKKLYLDGAAVKQAAYDVQHHAWSKADVVGRPERLALAKQLSATPIEGSPGLTSKLSEAVSGTDPMPLTAAAASPPYSPIVVRSLAVAALAALGYADDSSLAQVMPLTADPPEADCLNLAKLDLFQCLAVAKPHYEDVFCLGQHALKDTGSCLLKGVGVAKPIPPTPVRAIPVTHVSTKAAHSTRARSRRHRD
ncbi:MAG: hypothetical protein KGO51_14225 [Alphaproteobacteria bacterium]|nr:hypothetical protein [Alphaproteobacteria bacterium]